MSAINLSHLRTRLHLLQPQIERPVEFIHSLREIFTYYADHTHPVSEAPSGVFTLPAFNTPLILNREIEQFLSVYCQSQPTLVLSICDLLWQEPEVELRRLAAQLLGKLPPNQIDSVINRIRFWSENAVNTELLPFLHQHASITIRKHEPERWMDLLNEWESSSQDWLVRLAIEGVIPLIDDRDYENLPAIFTFVTPWIINPGTRYQFELLAIIEHLAHRSEVETVYFLKKAITLSTDPDMGRFIRRALIFFSPPMQDSLRKTLREYQSVK